MMTNIVLFILGSLYFALIISLGKSEPDKTRRWWINHTDLYFRLLKYIFRNRIHFTGEPLTPLKRGVTVLNANHTHNLDNLILFACYTGIGLPEGITSISSLDNTSNLDKKVLKMNSAVTVSTDNFNIEAFRRKLTQYTMRSYPTLLLTYFEGIALNHLTVDKHYEYIGKPQYVAFQLLADKFPGKQFYDYTIHYRISGKPLDPKDPYFVWKLITGAEIYIHSRICKFPMLDKDPIKYLDNLYSEKNEILRHLSVK